MGKDAEASEKKRHIVIGILAHVDAGKTTLSESLLYLSGKIRKQGRVDHGDAYLDTDSMEKKRGITIFSKQAELSLPDMDITLLDTPGHVDFSPEMERTLSVLDYAVLVISAPDGVTGQVRTLWRLLCHYKVPAFLFVNKMDQPGMDREKIAGKLKEQLSDRCVLLPDGDPAEFDDETEEEIAVADDSLLEEYLENGKKAGEEEIARLVLQRKLFPVLFGSALKNQGVRELSDALVRYCREPEWPDGFCARIFKISRDPSGARLSWVRVLGGVLRAKMDVEAGKIDQIRRYSGSSFETLREAGPGEIVCVLGLDSVRAGQTLTAPGASRPGQALTASAAGQSGQTMAASGTSQSGYTVLNRAESEGSLILPVFRSTIFPDVDLDSATVLKNLRILEEEEPLLKVQYDTRTKEISADIMGQVETEIIREMCISRFGMKISFGPPSIVYRETIKSPVEGVGHYEPLRHYSEVHLLLEPAERGAGITFDSRVSTDDLALNWQRLILSSLMSEKFRGVLTGSEITDMKITLIGGRASEKHTEGGDFRQSSVRAVRMGLMSAESVLLEPWYRFEAEIPQESIGRLMADVQRMEGKTDPPGGDGQRALVTGSLPAAETADYAQQVRAYTHGTGQITFSLMGYEPCRHPEDVILKMGYDPAADLEQPADSVFCSHGAGVVIPWQQVREHMHVDTGWDPETRSFGKSDGEDPYAWIDDPDAEEKAKAFSSGWRKEKTSGKMTFEERQREIAAGEDELKAIFERTYRGSSWRTPLHNKENEPFGPDYNGGVWSRDGSLERSMGLAPGGTQEAGADPGNAVSGAKKTPAREDYLLVDGYNIIFAWEELRKLAEINLDSAAGKLTEVLSDFQGTQSGRLIIVFDAYRVHGGKRKVIHEGNVDIIYTKEAETADSYIMELTHTLARKGNVTVATGDGIVQMIIFSAGARRMSAAELKDRVDSARADIREKYHTL